MLVRSRFLISVLLLAAGLPAAANTAYSYSRSNRELYEIVITSDKSDVDLEPGIYKVQRNSGQTSAVLLGEVLGVNRSYKGILSYAAINDGSDSAHDALSVVDGRLVLFNHNTNPKVASSFLTLSGLRSDWTAADILHGGSVEIPKIQSLDDVRLVMGPMLDPSTRLPNGGRFYLASIRSPSPMGTGLTLGFVVEAGSGPRAAAKIMNGKAWVLGYEFLDDQALERLFADGRANSNRSVDEIRLFAPAIISKFSNQLSRLGDLPAAEAWNEQVARFQKYLRSGLKEGGALKLADLEMGIPQLQFLDRHEWLAYFPLETVLAHEDKFIGQAFDPNTGVFRLVSQTPSQLSAVKSGRRELHFMDAEDMESATVAKVRVDRDPKTQKFLLVRENDGLENPEEGERDVQTESSSFILFSEGRATLLARSQTSGRKDFQALPIHSPDIAPTDTLRFTRRTLVVNNLTYQVYFVLRKKVRAEKSEVYAWYVLDNDKMSIVHTRALYEGPAMSFREMTYRIANDVNGDLLFDAVSPVRGASHYLKPEKGFEDKVIESPFGDIPIKDTPYERVGYRFIDNDRSQGYLRSERDETIVPDYVYFREYNPTGALQVQTGFYLRPRSAVASAKIPTGHRKFMAGYPLFSEQEKSTKRISHVIQNKVLQTDSSAAVRFPPVAVTLFPFTEKVPVKTSKKDKDKELDPAVAGKFQLGMAFTPQWGVASEADGVMGSVEIPYPYKSLAYTQVIQGRKGHSNEFQILLFFRQDEELQGSVDGVVAITGLVKWDNVSGADRYEVGYASPVKIFRGKVTPAELASHLLVDAEGAYYWTDDGNEPDWTKSKIRLLSRPADLIPPRSSNVMHLRKIEDFKDSDVGFVSAQARYGSRWEIFSAASLRDLAPSLKEKDEEDAKDKKEAEDADAKKDRKASEKVDGFVFEAFEKYLDTLVTADPHPRVILVDNALKEKFKARFFRKLAEGQGPLSLKNHKLNYYHANATLDDVEISEELEFIASPSKEHTRLLYLDSDMLKGSPEVVTRSQQEATEEEKHWIQNGDSGPRFSAVEANAKANLLCLIASDGKAKSYKGVRKLGELKSRLPIVTFMTPQEWRALQYAYPREVASGVLDNYELNNDFLTSSWTVWPPKSERASDEMKSLPKVPYKSEEMRVFPTLDKILTDAASGRMVGQQQIIIVPPELKSLVQKLILLRWATIDPSAGLWSHQNRKLALFRLQGSNNNLQHVVQDNFRAMRGAAHSRNSVLYADLESILKAGRPSGQGVENLFRLRDPIRSSRGLLLESDEALSHDSHEAPAVEQDDLSAEELESELGMAETDIERLNELLVSQSRRKSLGVEGVKPTDETQELLNQAKAYRQKILDRMAAIGHVPGGGSDDDDATQRKATGSNPSDTKAAPATKTISDKSAYPHMLWWLASEGQSIQPRKKATWNMREAMDYRTSMILVGTEEELQRIEAEMAFESKFFNMSEHFKITHLEAPDIDTKFQLVQQLFDRPEVSSMGIEFQLKAGNDREPRSQLIHHFINRIDQMAYNLRIEKTSAFVRSYIALKNALVEDLDLRRDRRIDERFIERLFTKVFPMQLNPDILDSSDQLNRLRQSERAVRDLQGAGYEGSSDLKRRFFANVMSQTRPTDASRPIPNSQILMGSTSTGKTFLLKSYFKMLDLKEYNRNKSNNEDADYIFISVAKLTDQASNEPDKIPVADAIKDILDLMSLPKGSRAHIVFDDFHKASSKGVRERLSQFIQGLFEAPNGMYTVRSKDGTRHREIPVQNLNIYMTLNPTANESVRKQYVKPGISGPELLKRETLAALAGDGFSPEESFLARWTDIIDLDRFPRSAKVPELVKRVRQSAGRGGQMILVDPAVIDSLIDQFPNFHARELLSPATAALTTLPGMIQPAPMYIVSRRESVRPQGPREDATAQELAGAVERMSQVDAIRPGEPKSLVRLMGFLMRNFRLQVFNYTSLEAHMSDVLRLDKPGQANLMKTQFLLGLSTHVLQNPRLPTSELVIRPEQFSFLTRPQLDDVIKWHYDNRPAQPYFPVNLDSRDRPENLDLENFLNGNLIDSVQAKSRREVLLETVRRVEQILIRAMGIYLRIDKMGGDLREVGSWDEGKIRAWFEGLDERDREAEFKAVAKEILEAFFDMQVQIHDKNLVDYDRPGESISLNLYDQVRLFAYAVDKAVVRMPWGQIANFTLKVAGSAGDLSLGTRASFREYVGAHHLSAFALSTPEFMNEIFATAAGGGALGPEGIERMKGLNEHFGLVCEEILLGSGGASK